VEGLHEQGVSEEVILALQEDRAAAVLPEPADALMQLAEGLTLDPAHSENQVAAALAAGWAEHEVAHAIFIVSYFNMVTRIADAFTLPPDPYHPYDPAGSLPMIRCEE